MRVRAAQMLIGKLAFLRDGRYLFLAGRSAGGEVFVDYIGDLEDWRDPVRPVDPWEGYGAVEDGCRHVPARARAI